MGLPQPVITHGRGGFWDGPVRKTKQLRALDLLAGVWISDFPDALRDGMAAPEFPGMIIDSVEEQQDAGAFRYSVQAIGSLSNRRPDKLIGTRERTTLEATFDEAGVEYISWRHAEKPCTGASATGIITCPGHRFENGDVVWFSAKTGGSSLALKTDYHVRDKTVAGFKLATAAGGAATALGSDITAGTLSLKLFARGATHHEHPYLFLVDKSTSTGGTDWGNVGLSYRGVIGSKPYKRSISMDGTTISGDAIFINPTYFPGGWADPRPGQIEVPKIVVEDLLVMTELPDFAAVPASDTPPPDAPTINLDFGTVSGDVTNFWPNEWAYKGLRLVDQVPGCSIYLIGKRWEYVFPQMVKG